MKAIETKRPDLTCYFADSAISSLRAYCGRTDQGTTDDYRTPLFGKRPREEVLSEWAPTLERGLRDFPDLMEYENDQAGKVGPLSIQKPLSERLDDVENYYREVHLPSAPVSDEAVGAVIQEWGSKIGGLRVKSLESTWDEMKKSTNSGNPFFMRKSAAYDKFGLGILENGKLAKLDGRNWEPIAILGWRGQEGGLEPDDVKQRVIWMFPMTLNVEELSFYQAQISACQKANLVPPWNGNDSVDLSMTELFKTKGANDPIICTDFSRMDQHFNAHCVEAARAVWSALLTRDQNSKRWIEEVFPVKFSIPLLLDLTNMIGMNYHGMASGSGGTNPDETSFHRCIQHEAAITCHQKLNLHSMCLGDDGILTFPGITLDPVLDTYRSHGHEMNESKQKVSVNNAIFLRRWYDANYKIDGVNRGVYSTNRALGKLMGQERFYDPKKWGPEMVIMRSLSIIENCRWHPLREKFLEFCVSGDKFGLGTKVPGFKKKIISLYESNELARSFGSYTEGGMRGITDWWCVKRLFG